MADIDTLLEVIDRSYNRRSWHGTNLRGAIRGVSATEAVWRPAEGRHNIRELVVHAAYWKYTAWRRLTGIKRGTFALTGSDFFHRDDPEDGHGWKADIALLDQTHAELRASIAKVPSRRLGQLVPSGKVTHLELIAGIAAHDVYHAGQIQLLKRLCRA